MYLYSFRLIDGEGNGTPLQYSCLENPMDGGAWRAAVHGVARSWTRLSDFTLFFQFHALEKEMATQCSCLEKPRNGGAWWAAVCGVAQSRTRLKRLSSSSNQLNQFYVSLDLKAVNCSLFYNLMVTVKRQHKYVYILETRVWEQKRELSLQQVFISLFELLLSVWPPLGINACMWNLEQWYRWTNFQGRNRDTDVKNKCMDTKEEKGRLGWIGSLGLTYTHCCV